MNKILTITLSTQRRRITLGSGSQYKILSHSGFDAADFDIGMMSSGYIDGGYISRARIDSRNLEISTDTGIYDIETARALFVRLFRPDEDITVDIDRCGVKRTITGRCSGISVTESNMYTANVADISILCPQPYLNGIDSYGKNIASVKPMIVFPFTIPPSGAIAGIRAADTNVSLTNAGDVPCGLRVVIKATGEVINPSVINNNTGEYVKVIQTLHDGDTLEISTIPRHKSVVLNGINSIQNTDRASVFFSLSEGENSISYLADEGYGNMDVYVYYTPQYLGV